MLEIPEEIKPLVSDYKMNLIELRSSDSLKFHNPDVSAVFDICRYIYDRDYDKIAAIYKDMQIESELGLVIGAITQSQKLINHALEMEQKGELVNMCSALEELEKWQSREDLRREYK